jgi:hypothetical protein
MKVAAPSLLLVAWVSFAAEDKINTTNHTADGYMVNSLIRSLRERGFTNLSEADLRRDPLIAVSNMFAVHAALPVQLAEWPAPQAAGTNGSILGFIHKHGWSMARGERFILATSVRTEPITGLPWPEIAARTFPAVTRDEILYVILQGFGVECAGVAWNPKTNRFDPMISRFQPLGRGWYAWSQSQHPSSPADRKYEGDEGAKGEPQGAATGSQPIRSETNSKSSAAGPHR